MTSHRWVEVVVVRHGETADNKAIEALCEGVIALRQGLVSQAGPQLYKGLRALSDNKERDASLGRPLNARGRAQARDIRHRLSAPPSSSAASVTASSAFQPADRVFISPLQRARDTYEEMFSTADRDASNHHVLHSLREATALEHLMPSLLQPRIDELEAALRALAQSGEQSDQNSPVARVMLIGHCKYFNYLWKQSAHMQNCDVWSSRYHFDEQTGRSEWSDCRLLHRTPLSRPHPIDTLTSIDFWLTGRRPVDKTSHGNNDCDIGVRLATEVAVDVDDDDDESISTAEAEPICRICHATQSERPLDRLIRPCRCAGTNAFVHTDCLRQWRNTSAEAFQQCSVCHFCYKEREHWLSAWLSHSLTPHLLAGGAVTALVLLVGSVVSTWPQLLSLLPVTTSMSSMLSSASPSTSLFASHSSSPSATAAALAAIDGVERLLFYYIGDWPPSPQFCQLTTSFWTMTGDLPVEKFIFYCWLWFECSEWRRILLSGLILVGTVAQVVMYAKFLYRLVVNWVRRHEAEGFRLPALLSLFVVGNTIATLRLFVVFGLWALGRHLASIFADSLRGVVMKWNEVEEVSD